MILGPSRPLLLLLLIASAAGGIVVLLRVATTATATASFAGLLIAGPACGAARWGRHGGPRAEHGSHLDQPLRAQRDGLLLQSQHVCEVAVGAVQGQEQLYMMTRETTKNKAPAHSER
jgi:hypothetical protein